MKVESAVVAILCYVRGNDVMAFSSLTIERCESEIHTFAYSHSIMELKYAVLRAITMNARTQQGAYDQMAAAKRQI